MYRLLLLLACSSGVSCTEIECEGDIDGDLVTPVCDGDDRPATLEYVQATILRPHCGNAQCHSGFRNTLDYRFDTLEDTIKTFNRPDALLVTPGDPDASFLYLVITRPTEADGSLPRMPYDQPLPI